MVSMWKPTKFNLPLTIQYQTLNYMEVHTQSRPPPDTPPQHPYQPNTITTTPSNFTHINAYIRTLFFIPPIKRSEGQVEGNDARFGI